jgi:hypothetical protein
MIEGFYKIEPLGPRSKQLVYAEPSEDGAYIILEDGKGGTVTNTTLDTWGRIFPEFLHVDGGWPEARIKFRQEWSPHDS